MTPEVIRLDQIVLRRLRPEDAQAMVTAINENLDHLRPWMPWAGGEGPTLAGQVAWLERVDQAWEDGTEYVYGIFGPDGVSELYGGTDLHRRAGPAALEIGYWLAARHTGRGYARAAARALTEIALRLPGITRVEIHCDQANLKSAAVPGPSAIASTAPSPTASTPPRNQASPWCGSTPPNNKAVSEEIRGGVRRRSDEGSAAPAVGLEPAARGSHLQLTCGAWAGWPGWAASPRPTAGDGR